MDVGLFGSQLNELVEDARRQLDVVVGMAGLIQEKAAFDNRFSAELTALASRSSRELRAQPVGEYREQVQAAQQRAVSHAPPPMPPMPPLREPARYNGSLEPQPGGYSLAEVLSRAEAKEDPRSSPYYYPRG